VRSSDYCPVTWRKSSRSNDGGYGDCVEVAGLRDEVVLRDSKDIAGPVLAITRAEWCVFLGDVRAGAFG